MAETRRDARAQIESLALESFSEHVLTHEAKSNTWFCGKPGTGFYHFRVAELPGAVLVWGDIGTMVITGRGYGLEWAAGSIRSPEYFLSKTNIKKDYFYADEFRNHLLATIKEYEEQSEEGWGPADKKIAEARQDLLEASYYDFDVNAYHDYMMKHTDSELHESVYGYDSTGYWMIEALKVFFRLYDEAKANDAPSQDVAGTVSSGMAGS